jgi:hypothetical protein
MSRPEVHFDGLKPEQLQFILGTPEASAALLKAATEISNTAAALAKSEITGHGSSKRRFHESFEATVIRGDAFRAWADTKSGRRYMREWKGNKEALADFVALGVAYTKAYNANWLEWGTQNVRPHHIMRRAAERVGAIVPGSTEYQPSHNPRRRGMGKKNDKRKVLGRGKAGRFNSVDKGSENAVSWSRGAGPSR